MFWRSLFVALAVPCAALAYVTPSSVGTAVITAPSQAAGRAAIGSAASGANTDITSIAPVTVTATGSLKLSFCAGYVYGNSGTGVTCSGTVPVANVAGGLAAANNLSDLASPSAARGNLGLGTLAQQASNLAAITGGTIDGTTIGGTTPGAGTFSALTLSGAGGGTLGYLKIGTGGGITPGTLGGMSQQNAGNVAITGGTVDGTPVGATTPAGVTASVLKLPSCTGYFYANAASAGTCSPTIPYANLTGVTLSGVTASMGGSSLAAFTCIVATVTVTGASASANPPQAVSVGPAVYPGDAFQASAYVSAGNTVKVKLCNITSAAATPTASTFGVRVIQ